MNSFDEIIGLESLWQLAFDSMSEKTRQDSRQMLVLLHLKLSRNFTVEDKREVMNKFLEKCMSRVILVTILRSKELFRSSEVQEHTQCWY